ncbi:MAG TPA: phosphoribosylformylglycinamidine synthase subunit PurQ, partial [Clostridium sp.]
EANLVANVTDTDRLRLFWRGKNIVDLKRTFLDTNGATQKTNVTVKAPSDYPYTVADINVKEEWINNLKKLNVSSKQGLAERFDATIGGGTVLMPFGGKYAKTPAEGMAAKIPVLHGESKDATLMTFGFNPELGTWSPYHMAYYSVIESITKLVAMGGDYRRARLTFQEYFERLGTESSRWGKPFAALLGAFEAQMAFEIPAIGGKDSMSGSFGDLDVPPTLVSFAIGVEKAKNVISPEFKEVGSSLVLLQTEKLEDGTINIDKLKKNLDVLYTLIQDKKVISASAIKFGGVSEAITKMTLGNRIGVEFESLTKNELFAFNYGTIILELKKGINIEEEFKNCLYKMVGKTIDSATIVSKEYDLNLNVCDLEKTYEEKLTSVFKIKTSDVNEKIETVLYDNKSVFSPNLKIAKPRVVIPVFPGNNCEYDCARAFEKEGAEVTQVVFRNITKEALTESIDRLAKEISNSQILMIPGGFSAGDEPDGSGKFIANALRNEKIMNSVMELLKNRDGLALGICNGFQALIKLGLVPYGEIVDIKEDMATLTYNNINRHMSSIISTKVVSNKSPWFSEVNLGDMHSVAISHGEGRFVAPENLIKELIKNGQVATQYVDFDGNVSLNMPFNPNGSMYGIEGITSPDGRVLGKMAHSERIGSDLYRNIPGDFDQKIFKAGVKYFK